MPAGHHLETALQRLLADAVGQRVSVRNVSSLHQQAEIVVDINVSCKYGCVGLVLMDIAQFACHQPDGGIEPLQGRKDIYQKHFQGLPKADKMEWIIQKAVELGIQEIVPVRMARCVVRLEDRDAEKKRDRWQKIARQAGKHSGRCHIPQVTLPRSVPDLTTLSAGLEACVVPWEEAGGIGPKAFCNKNSGLTSLGILIGPEGGIEPAEIQALSPRFQPITLGPRILRTETAGLACAAAFLALLGEMG